MMALNFDQNYLRNQQYRNSTNLDARMQIHCKFSQNPYGWQRWVYEHLDIHPGMRILELGCGMGKLWLENLTRLPDDVQITLTDYSEGMLSEAKRALGSDQRFTYLNCDAQAIPLPRMQADLVIANHMLYHVPDINRALNEIKRVLRPQGHLAAATNGAAHLMELYDLLLEFDPAIQHANVSADRFGLENGGEHLSPVFRDWDVISYPDALWVTETPPLIAYILSMWSIWGMGEWTGEKKARLECLIDGKIKASGGIYIQKSSGIFWTR